MPTYQYKCPSCEFTFAELFVGFSEAEKNEKGMTCPKCGEAAERYFDRPPAVKFEGGGWTEKGF